MRWMTKRDRKKHGEKKKWDQETRDGQKGDEEKRKERKNGERNEKEMKVKRRYEEQGIWGTRWERKKLRKRRKNWEVKVFSKRTKKETMKKIELKGRFDKVKAKKWWEKGERKKRCKNPNGEKHEEVCFEQKSEQNGRFTKKETNNWEWKEEERKTRRNRKIKDVHQKQSSKTKRRYFFKRRRNEEYVVQELNTEGRCEAQFEFSFFWKSIHSFVSKMDKKGIAKKRQTLQNECFFVQKVEKTKKKLEMRKLTKKLRKPSQP